MIKKEYARWPSCKKNVKVQAVISLIVFDKPHKLQLKTSPARLFYCKSETLNQSTKRDKPRKL